MAENVQSVVRAFSLLRSVVDADGAVSLADLSADVGLPKSTARRLLATLEEVGVVERGPGVGTYQPSSGLASYSLSGPETLAVHSLARPFLRDLMEATNEDATLAIVDGASVVFTDQVVGPNPITVPTETGERYPIHTVASGYLFMGTWTADAVNDYCDVWQLDSEAVHRTIAAGRDTGYVWHDGWIEGVSAVAALVSDPVGPVATVGAFGPSYRFGLPKDRRGIGQSALAVAQSLSARLA